MKQEQIQPKKHYKKHENYEQPYPLPEIDESPLLSNADVVLELIKEVTE